MFEILALTPVRFDSRALQPPTRVAILGGGFAGLVLTTVLATVIMQEVHYPEPASTQKLWLPCPAPAPGTWSALVETRLDTSALARGSLRLLRIRE